MEAKQSIDEDLEESANAWADQFDRSSPTFHGGLDTPVPTGGARVPDSMKDGSAPADWQEMPDAQIAIEPDYSPEYYEAQRVYETMGEIKKSISVLNKPVEQVLKVRLQYKGASGDDQVALESRVKGEEKVRDGALGSVSALVESLPEGAFSERALSCIAEALKCGAFDFEGKEGFGDFMTCLQRCNQAIFADQRKLLQKIKALKKASAKPVPEKSPESTTNEPVVADAATAGA